MYNTFDDWESGLYLAHHGIKGQKWGVRNYQNSDGTLTAAGRARYGAGEGGSKRMSRQYNRQLRKLNKLQSRADVNQQAANAEKYDRRAKKAMKVGNIAAGVAAATGLGSYGLGRYASKLGQLTNESTRRQSKALLNAYDLYQDDNDTISRMYKNGDISKGYADKLRDDAWGARERAISDSESREKQYRIDQNRKIDIAEKIGAVKRYASYAAAGTAAISYGVAAVNKLQARAARTRMTEVGHQKAVQKARAQMAKMEKMFANTPYADLLKQQQRRNKNQRKTG